MYSLKFFIDEREKYIYLFKILNQHQMPKDIRNYILTFTNLKIDTYNEFNDNLKLLAKNSKLTLSIDALYMLNYMVQILIKDIILKAHLITQYQRNKRLSILDIEYALGVYPCKNSKLIHLMMQNGAEVNDRLLEHKYTNSKLTKKQIINTYFNYSVVKKLIDLHINPDPERTTRMLKGKKVNYDNHQVDINSGIYTAAILDILIEQILHMTHENIITADDILKVIKTNIEVKSLWIELFPHF